MFGIILKHLRLTAIFITLTPFTIAETQQSSGHALATKRTCISCSSNDFEPVCMENPNFADSICESNSGLCYTSTPEIDILIRGCVGDKNIGSPEKCTDSDECISCGDKDKCNNEKVRTERCFAIKYDKDNQIQLNDSLSVTCPLAPIPLGCYHLTDTKSIEKGCVSSLNKEQRKSCRTNKLCQICFGINCNADKASRKECFMCSSQIDSDCLQPTDKSSKGFCPNSETPCIVGVDNYGHTHRRCAKDPTSNAKDFPKGFRTCNDNNCNGIIFPENRLQCYRCKQSKECDELTSQNTGGLVSHACQYFKENDDCFSFIESENRNVARGCLSDATIFSTQCEEYPARCKTCAKNGCNDHKRSTIIDGKPRKANLESFAVQSDRSRSNSLETISFSLMILTISFEFLI